MTSGWNEPPPSYVASDSKHAIFRWGPGKSGPRLIQDLAFTNLQENLNDLCRFPESLLENPHDGNRHAWVTDLLHNEEFHDSRTLRACCENTRLHVEMTIDYRNDNFARHCQSLDKLHHFQSDVDRTIQNYASTSSFTWCCSRCSTELFIVLRPPQVPDSLLSALYRIRPQSSFSNPLKDDASRPSRFSTLSGLEYLLRNTAEFNLSGVSDQVPREIGFVPESNFAMRVGLEQEVINLMKSLMFTFCPADHEQGQYIDESIALEEMETDGIDWVFRPANPLQPGVRSQYRRLRLEMQILARKAQKDVNDAHRQRMWNIKHERAEVHMQALLDANPAVYSMAPKALSIDESTAEEPCYHKLGVVADFQDVMVVDFFTLQCKHDQPNSSYYMSALEAIAKRRGSMILLTELQTQKSMGAYTREDLSAAYRLLLAQVSPQTDSDPLHSDEDDETLINIAASMMLDDIATKQGIRQALMIIADSRDSNEIRRYLNKPEREFEDVTSALRYLEAEASTDDDFLITLYDLKKDDNDSLARAALQTIADERKNVRLKRFLDTGDRSALPSIRFNLPDEKSTEILDPDLAYSRLGIDDRTIDDDMLITLYQIRILDDPDEESALKNALELLGQTRRSSTINTFLLTGSKDVTMYDPPLASQDCPVGLENIGNTCYLNSLLQYYFTIKPLREALMNLDGIIEEEINDSVLQRKKVGGRAVTRHEIERALKFVMELRSLFRSLISSSAASLKPTHAVCFLALVSERDEKSDTVAPLGDITGPSSARSIDATAMPLHDVGPNHANLSPKMSSTSVVVRDRELIEPMGAPTDLNVVNVPVHDRAVSHSLDQQKAINAGINTAELQVATVEDSEKTIPNRHSSDMARGGTESFCSSSEHKASSVALRNEDTQLEHVENVDMLDLDSTTTGTELVDIKQDVIPPKPPTRRQSSLLWAEVNDWGKQQDVAECIDNVLFQLEAALLPTGFDSNGEQIDLVKRLFYGMTKQTLNISGNVPQFTRFSNTIVTLENDGQDIYQALDGVFELREVELNGSQVSLNLTIDEAPPIMQVQIQRVDYDRVSKSAVKSNLYLALNEVIYLDRYLETHSVAISDMRKQYRQWKQKISAIATKRSEIQNLLLHIDMVGPQHNDHVWSATENEVPSDDETEESHVAMLTRGSVREVGTMENDVEHQQQKQEPVQDKEECERELRALEAEERDLSYRMSHAFDDYCREEYRLHAVFIHRGEASHGHYWVYIYDFTLEKWRKYNDEEVTDVSREEIFKDRTGQNENPYMLSYVRTDKLSLTDALERDIGKVWEEDSLL